MKNTLIIASLASPIFLAVATATLAQGTFVYDQQSSVEGADGEFAINILANQPLGQSFTPSLNTVGFIRLRLSDPVINGLGGTVTVYLRSNSISGTILSTSPSVSLPDGYGLGVNPGYTDFVFPSPVQVTPSVQYFIHVVQTPGIGLSVGYHNSFGYSQGAAIFGGVPQTVNDLWFREGIYIPEPSVLALLGLTTVCFIFRQHKADR